MDRAVVQLQAHLSSRSPAPESSGVIRDVEDVARKELMQAMCYVLRALSRWRTIRLSRCVWP